MAIDIESAIRGAISDTSFSPSSIQRPGKRKPKRLSESQKKRMARNKRARDYAPGGKWGDNFVNKLLPGVNDKYSLLSNDQLADWYSSRGLEPKDYSKPGDIITGALKFTPGNIIKTILSGDKKDDIVENTPAIDASEQTPKELFDFAKDMSRSVKDAAASSDDGFISGLLNVANDMRSIEPTPGRSFDQPYTSSLPTSRTDSMVDYQNRFPSLLLGSGVNVPRDNFDIPTEMPVVEEVTPPSLPYMDYLPLINAANVGQDYTTRVTQPVDFRIGLSPLEYKGEDYSQQMLDNFEKEKLLDPYSYEINRNYQAADLMNRPVDVLFGAKPQIENATAGLFGYAPNRVEYNDLTYPQQLEYDRIMQDLRNRAQQYPNIQTNLLGYY